MTPGELPKDKFASVGQINTRYWDEGEGQVPIILIHGLGGFVESWMGNIEALAKKHRVIAVDLVGFGRSEKPPVAYSIPYLSEFIRDFMATLRIERAVFVGNSMGGAIALQIALTFSEMVDRLVLVASAGLGKEASFSLRILSLPLIGEILSRPSYFMATQTLKSLFLDPVFITEEFVELTYEISSLPGAQEAFLAADRSMFNLWGAKEEFIDPIMSNLHKINMATLIIWGDQDNLLPINHAHFAVEKLPNAEIYVFGSCGHCPQIERAGEFNDLVLKFLDG
ncbi:alpha/beta fold hydrolase [bacterium]|nr:alpha/beta fold hydrolase [bacterium]